MKSSIFVILSFLVNSLAYSQNDTVPIRPLFPRFIVVFRHGLRRDVQITQALENVYGGDNDPDSPLSPEDTRYFRNLSPIQAGSFAQSLLVQQAEQNGYEPWNSPLVPQQSELEASFNQLMRHGLIPGVIITSPYRRTLQTAIFLQERLRNAGHPNIEIRVNQHLQEWPHAAYSNHRNEIGVIPWEAPPGVLIEEDGEAPILNLGALAQELIGGSERIHRERLANVIHEIHTRYRNPWIIGHGQAVASLFPSERFINVIQGGYALIRVDINGERLLVQAGLSHGVTLTPLQPSPPPLQNMSATAEPCAHPVEQSCQ